MTERNIFHPSIQLICRYALLAYLIICLLQPFLNAEAKATKEIKSNRFMLLGKNVKLIIKDLFVLLLKYV